MVTMQGKRPYPPLYLLLSIGLITLLNREWPLARWLDWPWRWAGAPLIAFGIAAAIALRLQFRRHDTTIRPFEKSNALITSGPYRVSRNPIYVVMALTLVGVAIMYGSASPFAVIPLFVWWINFEFIRREEKGLTETFGDEYIAYTKKVRRWL